MVFQLANNIFVKSMNRNKIKKVLVKKATSKKDVDKKKYESSSYFARTWEISERSLWVTSSSWFLAKLADI